VTTTNTEHVRRQLRHKHPITVHQVIRTMSIIPLLVFLSTTSVYPFGIFRLYGIIFVKVINIQLRSIMTMQQRRTLHKKLSIE
jgi:hypothetical protein